MGNQIIICDECKAEFELNIFKERLNDGVERNFLKCPNCEKEYSSFYTNPSIRENQKKVRSMWERFRSTKSIPKKEGIQRKIEKEQQKIKNEMDSLKEIISRQ